MTPDEIGALITVARIGERIRAQVVASKNAIDALDEIATIEPFLLPELVAAASHLNEAAEAMIRMIIALDARYDVQWRNPPDDHTEGSG